MHQLYTDTADAFIFLLYLLLYNLCMAFLHPVSLIIVSWYQILVDPGFVLQKTTSLVDRD